MINLLFFARLREELQTGSDAVEFTDATQTVADIVTLLKQRGAVWEELFGEGQMVLVAVNQEMCDLDAPVSDGDEVAFFPPVTGG
jgi:molybdopterin synthase sulfur carrier subunit